MAGDDFDGFTKDELAAATCMSDDPIVQAWRIAEALAEAESPEGDSEYESELRERGIDPDAEAERLQGLMLAQVQLARKARLHARWDGTI